MFPIRITHKPLPFRRRLINSKRHPPRIRFHRNGRHTLTPGGAAQGHQTPIGGCSGAVRETELNRFNGGCRVTEYDLGYAIGGNPLYKLVRSSNSITISQNITVFGEQIWIRINSIQANSSDVSYINNSSIISERTVIFTQVSGETKSHSNTCAPIIWRSNSLPSGSDSIINITTDID